MYIKICGITNKAEVIGINRMRPDFVGFVVFVPKSKRNITVNKAREIIKLLNPDIKTVAVTISPDKTQIDEIIKAGFSYVQLHGDISDELLDYISIPVLKAFNVSDMHDFFRYNKNKNVKGFVFDATEPGKGEVFDWNLLKNIPEVNDKIMLLAGGLNPLNVKDAIKNNLGIINGVDVSSGVENENGQGKSIEKITDFVNAVRNCELPRT